MRSKTLINQARRILNANDRGGYCVPTAGLYPFQWNWDSGITALGWATFDEGRAWTELEVLFKGQWSNGMVPHIVFHAESDGYFPGPDQWGVEHTPSTSAISQPPLLATMVRMIYEKTQDKVLARQRLVPLLPKLASYHRYFYRDRDLDQSGLVVSYHPWESGMDNSPAWDDALESVPCVQREYQRRDTLHVDSDQRPLKKEYDRFLYLVDTFKNLEFNSEKIYAQCPYKIKDVSLNAILLRANDDLLSLADELSYEADLSDLRSAGVRARDAIAELWSDELNCYVSQNAITGALIPIRTSGGLMPLYAGIPSAAQAGLMAATINPWLDKAPYGLASTHPDEGTFDAKRYWRGPSWLHINWMLAIGLQQYGLEKEASRLKSASERMIQASGFWEYFDPRDGAGCGGSDFSWTAAVALFWFLQEE